MFFGCVMFMSGQVRYHFIAVKRGPTAIRIAAVSRYLIAIFEKKDISGTVQY